MAGVNSSALALAAAIDSCWEYPAKARLCRRSRATGVEEHVVDEHLVVPSAKRPWLLLPAHNRRAASASVRRYALALPPSRRAARLVLALAARTGLVDLLVSDRISVTTPTQQDVRSLHELLASILGEPVTVSVGVGTPRSNRKPVLQVMSHRGRVLAFAKLGHDDVTRALLRDEAAALRQLTERRTPGLTTPRLEHHGRWQEVDVLVQTAVPTHVLQARRNGTMPTSSIREFVATFDEGERTAISSPMWDRVVAAIDDIEDATQREQFADVVARTGERLGRVNLRHSAWHGDWTPWNMSWGRDSVCLWDWERFATGVPVGFDALHFAAAIHADRTTWPETLAWLHHAAPDITGPIGVPAERAHAVLALYMLELCRRYLLAAQPDVGVSLRPRAATLLDHLMIHAGSGATSGESANVGA